MPRGRPRKNPVNPVVEEKEGLVSADGIAEEQPSAIQEPVQEEAKEATKCGPPHLPGCQCVDKLGPGQAYFEDGATGTVIIAEDTKREVWARWQNGGRGGWVNRQR